MLLRLEAEIERERMSDGTREGKILKYEGLKARTVGEGKNQRKIDMIVSPTACSRLRRRGMPRLIV